MPIRPGVHQLGPENATLQAKTYREGLASKAGHDLILDVTQWEATVEVREDRAQSSVELTADPRSLQVREGLGGVKPLTDKERSEIHKNIEQKVLGRAPISFRSTALELGEGGRLHGRGELEMVGNARPVNLELTLGSDGTVSGGVPLTQSEWGIRPYRGLMGALKVQDVIEIVIDARLPAD
ncbi:MAG TPA: YceI family protein [Thermoleophilaceae bacterium]|nr:YceI family protein [Thermoleophilaceae bacterium]